MNFLNLLVGSGLFFMGIYTFSVSGWDWISIFVAIAQLLLGIYLFWSALKRQPVPMMPMQGVQ